MENSLGLIVGKKYRHPGIGTFVPLHSLRNFSGFDLVKVLAPGDGHCFMHAVFNGLFYPYRKYNKPIEDFKRYQGKEITEKDEHEYNERQYKKKLKIVRDFRETFAQHLEDPADPDKPNGPIIYDTLGRGSLKAFAEHVDTAVDEEEKCSLPALISLLRSDKYLGLEMIEMVSNFVGSNIFIIRAGTQDVYSCGDNEILYKNRNSVVLYWQGNHYDLLGLLIPGNDVVTHFGYDHPFIKAVRSRLGIDTSKGKGK